MRKWILIGAVVCLVPVGTLITLRAVWFSRIPNVQPVATPRPARPAVRTTYEEFCDAIDQGEATILVDLAKGKANVGDGTMVEVDVPVTCSVRLHFEGGEITSVAGSFDQFITIASAGNPKIQIKSFTVGKEGIADFSDIRLRNALGRTVSWALRDGMRKLAGATIRVDSDLYSVLQGHFFVPAHSAAQGPAPALAKPDRESASGPSQAPMPDKSRPGFASLVRGLQIHGLTASLKEGAIAHVTGSDGKAAAASLLFGRDAHLAVEKATLSFPTAARGSVQLQLDDTSLTNVRVENANRLALGGGSYVDVAPESRITLTNARFTPQGTVQEFTIRGSVVAKSGRIVLTSGPRTETSPAVFTLADGSKLEVDSPGLTLSHGDQGDLVVQGKLNLAKLQISEGELHLGGRSVLRLGKGEVVGGDLDLASGKQGLTGVLTTTAAISSGAWDFGSVAVGIGGGTVKCSLHLAPNVNSFTVGDLELRGRLNVSGPGRAASADLMMTKGSVQVQAMRLAALEADIFLRGTGPTSLRTEDAYGLGAKPDLFQYDHHGTLTTVIDIGAGWEFAGHIKCGATRLSGDVQQQGTIKARVDFDSNNPQYGKGGGKVGNESGDNPHRCIVYSREHGDIPGDVEVWLLNTSGAVNAAPNAPPSLDASINGARVEFAADGIYLVADADLSLDNAHWDFWTEHGLFDGQVRDVVRQKVSATVNKMTHGLRLKIGDQPG